MKAATVKMIKENLKMRSKDELIEICLSLSKFKKESKEFLTYLLFEADDENYYVEGIKEEINDDFKKINFNNYYYVKKSVRKILRATKKNIRYSKKKQTEIELLLHFCKNLSKLEYVDYENSVLNKIFYREINKIKKLVSTLHPDLQYDYEIEISEIEIN